MKHNVSLTVLMALFALLCWFPFAAGDEPKTDAQKSLDVLKLGMLRVTEKHDAKAAAALFADDADMISHSGETAKGRDQIETLLAKTFDSLGSKGKLSPAMPTIRTLGKEVLIFDGQWEVTGVQVKPIQGRYTMIVHNRAGKWQIVSARSMVPFDPAKPGAK